MMRWAPHATPVFAAGVARACAGALLLLTGCEWITLPIDTGVYDADGDGYDSLSDCDDYNDNVHPLSDDSCNGIDNNCSGDESDASDAVLYYQDLDGDDFGSPGAWVRACEAPVGYVENPWDCDDGDDDINPGAPEIDCTSPIDFNCDGFPGSWDEDRDGTPACVDCDDRSPAIHPDAVEVCNRTDDDCDGITDEEVGSTWYTDADGDGWGDPATTTTACMRPVGAVADGTDCDDSDGGLHPDAPEACNAIDDDCDGEVDEADRYGNARWFRDADEDGYGDPDVWEGSCTSLPGYTQDETDCDDASPSIHPDADESCDGIDEDCDGTVDDNPATAPAWYNDSDRDTYGNPGVVVYACTAPARHVSNASDCDDSDRTVNPGAPEECNLVDDDCDAAIDEAGATGSETWYPDLDGDGYGDDASPITSCDQPAGAIALGGDCDDDDPSYNPDALEVDCSDPADYNCDGSTGRDDADADGWEACEDCDDADPDRSPDAVEVCDDRDDDCDGEADEDATDATDWYTDADGDGWGAGDPEPACDAPVDGVAEGGDCDDTNSAISPSAFEVCSTSEDDNCDGELNLYASDCTDWHPDADGDGWGGADALCLCVAEAPYTTADAQDCDDTNAAVSPSATEVCGSGEDDDCDDLALGCGVAGELGLADADARLLGDASADSFGSALSDGDGAAFITAPEAGGGTGAVYRFDDLLGATDVSGASAAWTGTLDEGTGRALALVDLDEDGAPSLLIGAPYTTASAGAVYVFDDPTTGGATSAADTTLLGASASDYTGYSLAPLDAGFAVGAYREATLSGTAGAVYIVTGPVSGSTTLDGSGGALVGSAAGDFFGRSLASGDLDGDGVSDVIVGAYGDDTSGASAGAAWFYAGPIDTVLTTADATAGRTGVSRADNAGFSVASGADIDGDGLVDTLVGAFNNDTAGAGAGAVYVVTGPVTGVASLSGEPALLGEVANDNVGTAITLGDLDGDGFADVIVAGDGVNYGAQAVWVVYGPITGQVALEDAEAVLIAEDATDSTGDALLVVPDRDADGFDELVVGAPAEDTTATDAGAVYVIRGGPGL